MNKRFKSMLMAVLITLLAVTYIPVTSGAAVNDPAGTFFSPTCENPMYHQPGGVYTPSERMWNFELMNATEDRDFATFPCNRYEPDWGVMLCSDNPWDYGHQGLAAHVSGWRFEGYEDSYWNVYLKDKLHVQMFEENAYYRSGISLRFVAPAAHNYSIRSLIISEYAAAAGSRLHYRILKGGTTVFPKNGDWYDFDFNPGETAAIPEIELQAAMGEEIIFQMYATGGGRVEAMFIPELYVIPHSTSDTVINYKPLNFLPGTAEYYRSSPLGRFNYEGLNVASDEPLSLIKCDPQYDPERSLYSNSSVFDTRFAMKPQWGGDYVAEMYSQGYGAQIRFTSPGKGVANLTMDPKIEVGTNNASFVRVQLNGETVYPVSGGWQSLTKTNLSISVLDLPLYENDQIEVQVSTSENLSQSGASARVNLHFLNIEFTKAGEIGDTDNSGEINVADLLTIKNYINSNQTGLTALQKIMSDMNGDKTVNADDTGILKNLLLKLPPESETEQFNSRMSDLGNLQYYHDGQSYRYGITNAGQEIFAYKDGHGNLTDLLAGGGTFDLRSAQRVSAAGTEFPVSWSESTIDGRTALTVTYSVNGADTQHISSNKTVYIFDRNHIIVQAELKYVNGTHTLSYRDSFFNRRLLKDRGETEKRLVTKFVYPQNGDDPYLDRDSIAVINRLDDYSVYTFLQSGVDKDTSAESILGTNLPLYFTDGKTVTGKADYALYFARDDGKTDFDYLARFEGRDSDFAAKITPVIPSDNNSAVFVGTGRDFNINVTNLTNSSLTYSLSYEVLDYYGTVLTQGNFPGSALAGDAKVNKVLPINPGKYGIFFINLTVSTARSSWKECYTFTLLPEHQFTDATAFGIAHVGPLDSPKQIKDAVSLSSSLGLGHVRFGIANIKKPANAILAAEEFRRKNIQLFGLSLSHTQPTNANDYKAWTNGNLQTFAKYLEFCETGNEDNLGSLGAGTSAFNQIFNNYKNYQFPSGEIVRSYGLRYALASICGGETRWFKALNDNNMWNSFDIMNIHAYGFPHRPDWTDSSHLNDAWNVEGTLKRTRSALTTYGNKDLYVSEVGLPTIPGSLNAVGQRTQADYMLRSVMLCLSNGAKWIEWYNFTDLKGLFGIDTSDGERYFGVLHAPDYYGITHPKPAGAAYGVMTRMLDGIQAVTQNPTYNKGTVRAFNATAAGGSMIVAWSNTAPLSEDKTGTPGNRVPRLTWQNQWTKTENVTFNATGSTVTVTNIMGNSTVYTAQSGKVTIPLNGSPVYISGVS